ncbi:MAG: hypothetical protein HY559_01755 [Gammaproteobacteria bacterium]|nr:hypothetical protein [Gammaproteobacteria bacterium]
MALYLMCADPDKEAVKRMVVEAIPNPEIIRANPEYPICFKEQWGVTIIKISGLEESAEKQLEQKIQETNSSTILAFYKK